VSEVRNLNTFADLVPILKKLASLQPGQTIVGTAE
jgi:hypothetical protein